MLKGEMKFAAYLNSYDECYRLICGKEDDDFKLGYTAEKKI